MKTLEELKALREKTEAEINAKTRIIVGMATCGVAAGADAIFAELEKGISDHGLDVNLVRTGCAGLCEYEPIFEVLTPGQEKVTYVKMDAEKTAQVIEQHLKGGQVVDEYTVGVAMTNKK